MDKEMYYSMDMASDSPAVARGIALHKMVMPLPSTTHQATQVAP
jgi:hypothetical protein